MIVEVGVPKRLEIVLLPRFGLSCERWVVFVEGCVFLVKQGCYPRLVLVGRFRKYEANDFYRFRDGKANRETCLQEDFPYSSEAVVLWLANDWGEVLNGGIEFGGDIG